MTDGRFAMAAMGFLGIEVLARIVLVSPEPSGWEVGRALVVEWVAFLVLLGFWVPRATHTGGLVGLGLRPWHFAVALLGYLVSMIPISLLGYGLVIQGLPTLQDQQPLLQTYPIPVLLGLALTGPVLEELFYRRYLVETVAAWTGRRTALLVSWLAFTLMHWKFVGFFPMLQIAVLSAFLVAIYERERSVWPCVLFHGVNSVLVYVVFPLLT